MCYKVGGDYTKGKNYTPASSTRADIRNPVRYQDLTIGALICMDIDYSLRSETLIKGSDIMCVPMHTQVYFGDMKEGLTLSGKWKNSILVVANSSPYGTRSFIANQDGKVICTAVNRSDNEIITRTLRLTVG